MEPDELEENLRIVFDKEESDQKGNVSTFFFTKEKEGMTLTYPNAETLLELFGVISNDNTLKSFFINSLKKTMINAEEFQIMSLSTKVWTNVGTSPLCFYTLIELNYTNEAIECLKKRQQRCQAIYGLINYMMDRNYFSSLQLKEISNKLNADKNRSGIEDIIQRKIIESRFQLLKKQIKKINVEINQDKKTVSEKINLLGLSENYNELLNYLDNFILSDTSKVVNAGMISTLRTFMADLLKDVAKRIAEGKHEEIPKIDGKSEMRSIRTYLKTKLELSENEEKFIDSFVDILHAEGGHSFMSEKEYFRLSRNIAIEIALFILSKYERKYKKS
jgi:hypothetical protein